MAGNDVAQAFNGKPKITGGVRMAALGTALPTDARTALADIFDQPGYISEDGLVETPERSTDKKKAWGGQTVKVIQTEYSVQYQFTFLQPLNPVVLRAVHGDQNVTTIEATAEAGNQTVTKLNAETLPHKVWVFDMKDGQALKRICVPDGQITEVGETNYQDEELAGYEVTLEAFYVEEYDANAIRYTDDGKFPRPGSLHDACASPRERACACPQHARPQNRKTIGRRPRTPGSSSTQAARRTSANRHRRRSLQGSYARTASSTGSTGCSPCWKRCSTTTRWRSSTACRGIGSTSCRKSSTRTWRSPRGNKRPPRSDRRARGGRRG